MRLPPERTVHPVLPDSLCRCLGKGHLSILGEKPKARANGSPCQGKMLGTVCEVLLVPALEAHIYP